MSDVSDALAERNQPDRSSTKKLPTFRVGYPKQLDALRAFAVLSENGTKPVRYTKVAEVIKVHEANVSSMNPFFFESGFIEKQGGGAMPHPALLEYNRAHQWKAETAGPKLAPIIAATWFGQMLAQRLQFRAMTEDEAVDALAAECMAGPDAKPQLKMLLDYCETAGIVRRDNGQLSAPQSKPADSLPPPPEPVATPVEVAPKSFFGGGPATPKAAAGGISFQINVNVDMAEMSGWSADRIASFFAGVAQVLAAQGKSES